MPIPIEWLPKIELGMMVSVRRSGQNYMGVVTKIDGDFVFVRWTNTELARPLNTRLIAMR